MAKYVKWNGDLSWDFSSLHTMEIDPEFKVLIETYLADVLSNPSEHRGWRSGPIERSLRAVTPTPERPKFGPARLGFVVY